MNAPFRPTTAHAVYSMSSMFRWGAEDGCTASAEAIAKMHQVRPEEDSEESAAGTEAHDEIERVLGPLERGESPLAINPDHPAAVGIARLVDYARQLPAGGVFFIERHVRLTDDIWGRMDIGHWHPATATLTIADLKNGFVGVDAEENEQLRGYAAAAIRTFNISPLWIRYAVGQENDFRPVPRIKQWVEPVADLDAFIDRVSKIPTGPLTFRFGAHCRDCPLLGICEPTRDLLPQLGATMARGPTGDVAPHLIPVFLALKKPIDHFFEAMLKSGAKVALAGGTVPGMKLVTALPNRAWKSESDARAAVLAAKGVEALKPPTPAQAEEMGVDVSELASRGKGYPVLALESDKRPMWAPPSAAAMFGAAAK
jgi:hypothetical protein